MKKCVRLEVNQSRIKPGHFLGSLIPPHHHSSPLWCRALFPCDPSHRKAGISRPDFSLGLPFFIGMNACSIGMNKCSCTIPDRELQSRDNGQHCCLWSEGQCPVVSVSLLRLSSVSISQGKDCQADRLSCHLVGVTFDAWVAVVSVEREMVQQSRLRKAEALEVGHNYHLKLNFSQNGDICSYICLTRSWQRDLAALLLCLSEQLHQPI